jgi:LysM domain-containing protein
LSLKLKRIVEALAVAALSVAVLVALPGTAEAQGMASTEAARDTDRVVVARGDSLWSISQEGLGPQATPPRIDREVERIYALNRHQIGPDPNLIFPGQELLVPPSVGQPASEPAPAGATRLREATTGAAQAGPEGWTAARGTLLFIPSERAEGEAEQAPRAAAVGEGEKAPDRMAKAPDLPEAVEAPAVGSPAVATSPRLSVASLLERARSTFASAASALAETFAQIRAAGGRLLLGVGTWLVTIAVVLLIVWKLPVRRTTRFEASPVLFPVRQRSQRSRGRSPAPARAAEGETGNGAQTGVQTGAPTDDVKTPKRRRTSPARAPNGRPLPTGGLALGAHDPRVRRAVLRGQTPTRARKVRAASSSAAGRPEPHSRPNERGDDQR